MPQGLCASDETSCIPLSGRANPTEKQSRLEMGCESLEPALLLAGAPRARAGWGRASCCLVPNVQGDTSQQLVHGAQLIHVAAACAGARKAPKDSR